MSILYRMKRIRKTYEFLKNKYRLLALKKYTTLAGTLVFFFIMSIVPLSFLFTLLIGKLPLNVEELISLPVFSSVEKILLYVKKEAENATASVSVIFVLTTLYSATNLFYQMRKSGEIIYDYSPSNGVKLRVGALVLLLIVLGILLVFFGLYTIGTLLFAKLLPSNWEKIADYSLLFLISFLLVLLLNVYVCPYKEKFVRFIPGAFITVVAWAGAILGFSVYIKIGNLGRLYGALSTIIVFLLWLYVLMICFIVGVILNSEKIISDRVKERKRKKRNRKAEIPHTKYMKTKIKSSFLVGLLTLFLSVGTNSSLKDIAKPYLGEYECKEVLFDGENLLREYAYIRLDLKRDETFALSYAGRDKRKREWSGKYVYDKEKQTICFTMEDGKGIKREFSFKEGKIDILVPIAEKNLVLRFEQK